MDSQLHIPLSFTAQDGTQLCFDLFDIENPDDIQMSEITQDIWCLTGSDARSSFLDGVFLLLQRTPDGTWVSLLSMCEDIYDSILPQDTIAHLEDFEGSIETLEEEFDGKYRFQSLLRVRTVYDEDGEEYEDEVDEDEDEEEEETFPACSEAFLLRVMELLLPETKFQVQFCNERPYIQDEEGNEYVLGSMISVNLDAVQDEIDWEFPEEADWIPFA